MIDELGKKYPDAKKRIINPGRGRDQKVIFEDLNGHVLPVYSTCSTTSVAEQVGYAMLLSILSIDRGKCRKQIIGKKAVINREIGGGSA